MKNRNNYQESEFTYKSGKLSLPCICIEDSKFAFTLEIRIIPDVLAFKVPDNRAEGIPIKFGDIYRSIEELLEKLRGRGLSIKSCGQCIYFGYTAMSFDMSAGTAGYCSFIRSNNASKSKYDASGIFDLCDAFIFRKERTETSPWLPP